jgi:hypothetical protein
VLCPNLEQRCRSDKKTVDGATALHTAIKFGVVEAVKATLTKYPDRFTAEDKAELSEIASDIYSHYKQRRREFAIHGRKIGPKHSYKVISELLEASTGGYLSCPPYN